MQERHKFSVVTLNVDHNSLSSDKLDTWLRQTTATRIKQLAPTAKNYMSTTPYDDIQARLGFYSLPFFLVVEPGGKMHNLDSKATVNGDLKPLIEKLSNQTR